MTLMAEQDLRVGGLHVGTGHRSIVRFVRYYQNVRKEGCGHNHVW